MSFNPKVKLQKGCPQKIDYTPVSAVTAGDVIIINGIAYFAESDIAAAALGSLAVLGAIWKGNKATGAFTAGDEVYWDPAGDPVTGTAGTGAFKNLYGATYTLAGYAIADAASGDQFVYFVKVVSATSGLRAVSGQATTVAASDTVVTGLSKVVAATASLEDAPVIGCDRAQAVIGDQAGTPAAGSILIKTFKPTGTGDATPIAATTFTKKVNWTAWGY